MSVSFDPNRVGGWIIAAIAVINLAVIVIGVLSLQNSRHHFERLAEVQTQNLVAGIEQSVSHGIDKIYQSMRAVAYEAEQAMAAGKKDSRALRGIIQQQKELLPEATGIRIFGVDGKSQLGHADTLNPNAEVNDRGYFLRLKHDAGVKTTVSGIITSRFTGDQVIVFSQRINRADGGFGGVVAIPVSVDYFKSLLAGFDVGRRGMLALRDQHLGLIARQPADFHGVKMAIGSLPPTPEVIGRLKNDGMASGSFRATMPSGEVTRTYHIRRLKNAPLHVTAGLAESDYLARWYRERWETIILIAAFMLVTGLAGWVLYRAWQQQHRDMQALQESHVNLKDALSELNERNLALSTAQTKGALGIFVYDSSTQSFSISPELLGLLGLHAAYRIDMHGWEDLLHPDDREAVLAYRDEEVIGKKQPFDREFRVVRPNNGEVLWIYAFGTTEYEEGGRPVRMRGIARDITERKRYEEQLQMAHEVFLHTREAVIITDEKNDMVDVNPAFTEMTGYDRLEALGKDPNWLLHADLLNNHDERHFAAMRKALQQTGYWEGEMACRRKDGTAYLQAIKMSAVRDEQGRLVRYITLASDVTQLRASQNQIEHLAYHDKLTNLPNRVMLADRLKQAIAQAERRGELLGVCYLDLDGFKAINDRWGHDTGDDVLMQIAQRLQQKIRAGDTVARLGGDEFVVLVGNARHVDEVEQAVRRMLTEIAQPIRVGQTQAQLTASIGVSIYPDDVADADLLIRRADQAMYIAKRSGKNQFHLFDTEAERRMRVQRDLTMRVITALEKNEFRLHYHPKVNMLSGQVVGMEALLRWQHPEDGLLSPMEFLDIIENTELSIHVGEWVIRRALQQMREWSAGGVIMPVSVNVSGYHLQRPEFVDRLSAMLDAVPEVSPGWLQLEILETTAMKDIETVSQIISDCARHGVSFALDDFGTGYSSLTYFRRLPTQVMKIDRTFVGDMLRDAEDNALVESIIKLARSFNREVIAEGVETIEQGLALMRMGCYLVQGNCIAKPMPPEEVPDWHGAWRMPQAWRKAA